MAKKRRVTVQTTDQIMAEQAVAEQPTVEQPTANVKYKDTIFRMLFSEPEHLLSLYNAVSGKNYQDPAALNIVTLENAVYMGMKNDLAFVLEMGLYLYEHQSTYNPNIPLRDLFYIASEYQALVDGKSLYSSGIQKIPTPKFIVFYNGLDRKVPDRMELRLSDAYENPTDEPDLELKVTMLNINDGHNEELMNSCHVLQEYAKYVARVRKYVAEMPLDEAVERAITECISEGILADFLRKNRAEVVKVSIFEYDKEKEEKKLRKAEFEYGREQGRIEGERSGRTEGETMLLTLIAKMSAGGDSDKVTQLNNPEVLKAMKEKYGIE